MKTLIHTFHLTLFIAVTVTGGFGNTMYGAWQSSPGQTLQAVALLFSTVWYLQIAGLLLWRGFGLGDLVDSLCLKVSRRSAFDVGTAVSRDTEIHQTGLQALKELRREPSGTTLAVPTEGDRQ